MITRRSIMGYLAGILSAGTATGASASEAGLFSGFPGFFPGFLFPKAGAVIPPQVLRGAEVKAIHGRASWMGGPEERVLTPFRIKRLDKEFLDSWVASVPNAYETRYADPAIGEYMYGVRCMNTPDQIALATDAVIRTLIHVVEAARCAVGGDDIALIWRIKPDVDSWVGEISEYREDGPDFCHATDRRCVIDRTIAYVKIRARFGFDTMPEGTVVTRSLSDPVPPGWEVVETIVDDNAVKVRKLPKVLTEAQKEARFHSALAKLRGESTTEASIGAAG